MEEKTPEQLSGRKTLRERKRKMEMVIEQEPQSQQQLLEDDLSIVEILQKMNREILRRNKSSKEAKVLPQTKILP